MTSFYRRTVRQCAKRTMRISVDQDCAIRTKPRWYDLLDHIIRLSLTFSTGRCKDAAVAFPKVLSRRIHADNDRSVLWLSSSRHRAIDFFCGILIAIPYHDFKIFFTLYFSIRQLDIQNGRRENDFNTDLLHRNWQIDRTMRYNGKKWRFSTVREPATTWNTEVSVTFHRFFYLIGFQAFSNRQICPQKYRRFFIVLCARHKYPSPLSFRIRSRKSAII